MQHTKIFKRADKSKVKIQVDFYDGGFSGDLRWSCYVWSLAPRKRTWISCHSTNDYTWRKLNMEDRQKDIFNKVLTYVTREEIQQVALELWEKIRPTFI